VDSPPSAAKAAALANRARFHAIADEMEEASRLAEEALELAVALGLEELQAHALNTRGIARTVGGDLRGVEDLEQSMSTAPSHSFERMRAMNNLAAIHIGLGELDRGFTLVEQSLQEARRLGHAVGIGWAETQLLDRLYWQGAWDELLERSEALLTLLASDALNTTDAHILRARVHLGRDALANAVDSSAAALELAERQGDPQVRFPAMATRASVIFQSGDESGASALVDGLLSAWRENPVSPAGPWIVEFAALLDALGRGDELRVATQHVRMRTDWLQGAEALVDGNPTRAADIYDRIGAHADAAVTRLQAADRLISTGRRSEADEQLGLALEFFRAAGAERYVREAEALFAVS
jgi:hypothetical protein